MIGFVSGSRSNCAMSKQCGSGEGEGLGVTGVIEGVDDLIVGVLKTGDGDGWDGFGLGVDEEYSCKAKEVIVLATLVLISDCGS